MTGSHRRAALAVIAVALVAAACGGSPATLSQRVRAWESGTSYGADQGYVTSDMREIAAGLRADALKKVRTSCDGLYYDAGTADGELPTPDAALTNDLNGEYLDAANAAESCSLATRLSGGRIGRYRSLIARATRDLSAARARINAISSG